MKISSIIGKIGNIDKKDMLKVLFKSDNFIIVNKHFDVRINSDDPTHTVTVETQLISLYPNLVDPSLGHSFRFVHRLDHATSGLLCIALNKDASKKAARLFANQKTTKHYLALVRGHVPRWEKNMRNVNIAIGKDSSEKEIHKCCTSENVNCVEPRSAYTQFIILEYGKYKGEPATKLLLIPYTGRSHQLRVHCAHIGHIIVGDYTYSNRQDSTPYRMMLHAYRLDIPVCDEPISIKSEDPFLPDIDNNWCPEQVVQTYDSIVKMLETQ